MNDEQCNEIFKSRKCGEDFYEKYYRMNHEDGAQNEYSDDDSRSEIDSPPYLANQNMKELEEKFQALRKENFSLKFRVYLLEEKLEAFNMTPNVHENLTRKNKGLQEQIDNLTSELEESKTLLFAAAKALEKLDECTAQREIDLNAKLMRLHTYIAHEFGIPIKKIRSITNHTERINETDSTFSEDDNASQMDKLRSDNDIYVDLIENSVDSIKQLFIVRLKESDERLMDLRKQIDSIGMMETQLSTVSQECKQIRNVLDEKNIKIRELDVELCKVKSSIKNADSRLSINELDVKVKRRNVNELKELALILESFHCHQSNINDEEKETMKHLLEKVLKLSNGNKELDSSSIHLLDSFSHGDEDEDDLPSNHQSTYNTLKMLVKILSMKNVNDCCAETNNRGDDLTDTLNSIGDRKPLSVLEYTRFLEKAESSDVSDSSDCGVRRKAKTKPKKMCLVKSDRNMHTSKEFIPNSKFRNKEKDDLLIKLNNIHSIVKKCSGNDGYMKAKVESKLCCALMSFIMSYTKFVKKL